MQTMLNKKETFAEAVSLLTELREDMFSQITQISEGYPEEAFYRMPFAGVDGYTSFYLSTKDTNYYDFCY